MNEETKKNAYSNRPKPDFLSTIVLICGIILILVAVYLIHDLTSQSDDTKAETKIDVWFLHLSTNSRMIGIFGLIIVGVYLVYRQASKHRAFQGPLSRNRQVPYSNVPALPSTPLNLATGRPDSPDKDYEVVNRLITTEFITRTLCKCSHEVTIRAITDAMVEVYDGRYPAFDKSESMIVQPPHRLIKLHDESGGWIPFELKLGQSLTKGQSTLIKMNFQWVSRKYKIAPDSFMVPFCKTDSLTFVTIFPPTLQIVDPVGETFHHFGDREIISTVTLECKENSVTWVVPHPIKLVHYRMKWKWA